MLNGVKFITQAQIAQAYIHALGSTGWPRTTPANKVYGGCRKTTAVGEAREGPMWRAWAVLAIAAICMSPVEAHAFERCDKWFASTDELRNFVFERAVRTAPKKYFDEARTIRIDIDRRSGKIFPAAEFDSDRRPVIVYPAAFPPILCRMALAYYVAVEDNEWQPGAEAAKAASKCVLSGKPREICLKDHARDLERRYRAKFAALSGGHHQTAYGIALDALGQIGKHEYAHHLLRHFDRIGAGSIPRIDAEFEADFYAVLNGAQAGEFPGAMNYFFNVMAGMEAQTEAMRSPEYESGECRATNIQDITDVFGQTSMMMVRFAFADRQFKLTPEVDLPKVARELAERGAPKPSENSCGRLSGAILREAHVELASLTALMAEYAHLLPRQNGELALEEPEALTLIERLQEQARGFKRIRGLAAQVLSAIVLRVGLAVTEAGVSRRLDAVVDLNADDILSGDYGRLLKAKALHVLYHSDEPAATRIDAAKTLFESAVTFQPDLSEAWQNLAMIAYYKGDCRRAAELANDAVRTASDKDQRAQTESLRSAWRKLSSNPKLCAELGVRSAENSLRPPTNSEKGCTYLVKTVITKREQLNEMNESCKKVKDEFGGDIEMCYKLYALLHNQMRGRGDTLKLSTDISERIMKGCAMVVYDISEEQADATMEKIR
jgi:tetratricopeptide (TPR) repeat protein